MSLEGGATKFSAVSRKLMLDPKTLSRKLETLSRHGFVEYTGYGYVLTELGEAVVEYVKPLTFHLPTAVVAEVLKCKWMKEILVSLLESAKHSSELVAAIPGLSWKIASDRFRKLIQSGLIRPSYEIGSRPVRVRYELTSKGRLLAAWLTLYRLQTSGVAGRSSGTQSYYTVGSCESSGE